MSAVDTEHLIDRLSAEAMPVRRQASPWLRAGLWLAAAIGFLALEISWYGLRPDFGTMIASTDFQLEMLGALATGIGAAIAAFMISVPDRSENYRWLPLPGLVLWLASLGQGCYRDFLRVGPDGIALHESFGCFQNILVTSAVLGILMVAMVRRGAWIRPELTAFLTGLAVAAMASWGLMFFHPFSVATEVLAWHFGTTMLVVAIAWALGRPILFPSLRAK